MLSNLGWSNMIGYSETKNDMKTKTQIKTETQTKMQTKTQTDKQTKTKTKPSMNTKMPQMSLVGREATTTYFARTGILRTMSFLRITPLLTLQTLQERQSYTMRLWKGT